MSYFTSLLPFLPSLKEKNVLLFNSNAATSEVLNNQLVKSVAVLNFVEEQKLANKYANFISIFILHNFSFVLYNINFFIIILND